MSDDLRERLAALINLQWRRYMSYHLEQCQRAGEGYVLSPEYYAALYRLCGTPYAELSESDKDKDREIADEFLALIGLMDGE